MAPAEFRAIGHTLIDMVAQWLEALPSQPVTRAETPTQVRDALDASRSLPAAGVAAGPLLEKAARLLFDHSLVNGHPRFFGYITSSPAPIGMLGDLLAAAINANAGAWRLAPMASEVEGQAVRWIAELLGYRPGCGGLFVSGGNMANIVGFYAARAAAGEAWRIRSAGVAAADARRLRVYASAETHTWVQKAADLSGLGTDAIRWIATDDTLRLDTAMLRETMAADVAAGDVPMIVIGTAGSVSTGAVDPLFAIADICREMGTWFHVDGAYGALAAALPDAPRDLQALHLADSVAIDPHKWLYAPLEAGCLLARDPDVLRAAFSYHPAYYHFSDGDGINYVDLGPQNSRGFRALKVWLALQHAGADGYRRMIGDDCALAARLYATAEAHPELDAGTLGLSIATFRYVPPDVRDTIGTADTDAYLDALNEDLLDCVQRSGEAFVSNAVVRGRYLLRACIVNINTGEADVDALPGIVVGIGRELHAKRRAGGAGA
ncbi:L-2,4-diaminobutyrate decarboxylase [Luteitalea pratensis]|uniref:L-2,4-diaminobutyrate decarboxylase n=2 Tax=Luteitalea pratensis TaxID=1855912 RepID=A0A143PFQ5_LUTPR|nr:L-2,4-diaminobutyrate decarboxylase [Luteitalea pratensis]